MNMFRTLLGAGLLALASAGLISCGGSHAQETPQPKGTVLMVVASPSANTMGWPIGFWAAELTHPYEELTHAGYTVEIASPDGGEVKLDAYSDPRDPSKYSAYDFTSLGFLLSPDHAPLLLSTKKLADVRHQDYVAIIVAGGMSPMYTFRSNATLHNLMRAFYETGRPMAALCHGTAALVDLQTTDGRYLVAGKTVTGFSKAEDDYADAYVGARLFTWNVEPALKERGANYVQGGMWADFATRDGNLITGQQQYSGRSVARLVRAQLESH